MNYLFFHLKHKQFKTKKPMSLSLSNYRSIYPIILLQGK